MFTAAAALLTAALGTHPLLDVPLVFRPKEDLDDVSAAATRAFGARRVELRAFTDARDERTLIGENTGEEDEPLPVTTDDDVARWTSRAVTEILKDSGVRLVREGADLVVTGEVTRFMVKENKDYRATVGVAITVKDAAGRTVWSGLATGQAKVWGRTYQEDNYLEALSDAVIHLAASWCADPAFVKALAAPEAGAAAPQGAVDL